MEETALFTNRRDWQGRVQRRGRGYDDWRFGDQERGVRENQDRVFQSRELEEFLMVNGFKTVGEKKIVKAINATIVARRDIKQEIAGPREFNEMLRHPL
ncbi:hypothetical protein LIER_40216 [Lithospermum erythrorhizon]|uniref:Uncharacterized protein n=1 Tax=Lithospermum erythrorhizon TaxID=34254 RepID=A0AAV3QUM3_LITER